MALKPLLIALLVFFVNRAVAQECFGYHETNCSPKQSKYSYNVNNASVSFLFTSGETRDIPFTFLLGKDYRITLCADPVFEGIIKIRILNQKQKVLYDNSMHNYNLNLEFSSKKTQDITLQIQAPEPNAGVSDTIYFEGCIGLLIEDMVSVKTGF